MAAALRREGLRVVEALDVREGQRLQAWLSLPATDRPMVVAAGGDGTVGAAVNYLAGTGGVVLGILPLGTNNQVARALGIPRRIEDAVHLLVAGKVSTIDVARCIPDVGEPRSFVHAAGMGVQAGFARLAASASLRRRLGRLTYVVATTGALLARRPFRCEVIIGDRRLRLRLVHLMVFNVPLYGGPLNLRLTGGIDDRRLDILAIEDMSLVRFLLTLAPMLFGHVPHSRGTHVVQARHVRITADRALEVALDGEVAGRLPAAFVLEPNALRVVTPQSFEDIDD